MKTLTAAACMAAWVGAVTAAGVSTGTEQPIAGGRDNPPLYTIYSENAGKGASRSGWSFAEQGGRYSSSFEVQVAGDYQLGMAWIEVEKGAGEVSLTVSAAGKTVRTVTAPAGQLTRFETRLWDLHPGDEIAVVVSGRRGTYDLDFRVALVTPRFDGLKEFRLADFGAAGDGKTNDLPAVQAALAAAKAAGGGVVRFDHTKQYRLVGGQAYALDLTGARNIEVVGSNPDDPAQRAKLLFESPTKVALIESAENVQVQGFIVDYDPLPYFQGRILSADASRWTVDIQVPDRYPVPETGEGGFVFGRTFVPDRPGSRSGSGRHLYVSKVERSPGSLSGRELRVFADPDGGQPGKEWKMKAAMQDCAEGKATELIVRTRNGTSNISYTFIIQHSSRVMVEGVRFYRVPKQGILPQSNYGPVTIRNVDFLMPDAGEDPVFHRGTELLVSWRGHYLTRNNRFGVLFDGGRHDGGAMYDDLYNGHVHLASVVAADAGRIRCSINRSADNWAVGDWVSVWNHQQTVRRGLARIAGVAYPKRGVLVVGLDRAITGIVPKDTTLVNEDLMNRGTLVRNWQTTNVGAGVGSMRLRTPVVFENCHLDNIYLFPSSELDREGPRSQGVVFRDCYIRGGEEPIDVVNARNFTLERCTIDGGQLHTKNSDNVILRDVRWVNRKGNILRLEGHSTVYLSGGCSVNGQPTGIRGRVANQGGTSAVHFLGPTVH